MQPFDIFITTIPDTPSASRRERESMAVKQLLTQALGEDTELRHDEYGAPFLPIHPELHISISHSTERCVLVTSAMPIGVDIEAPRPQLMRIAHKYLTPNEKSIYEQLRTNTSAEECLDFLLKLWTAKEATFKAASIHDLVVSEIGVAPDLSTAIARNHRFSLIFPSLSTNETIAIATPLMLR